MLPVNLKKAQVYPKTFTTDKTKTSNNTTRHFKTSEARCLLYSEVSKVDSHIRVCADASFAGKEDLSSQLGFIVLICDSSNRAHVVEKYSKKSKRNPL